jgi:hypothetical protein
MTIDEVKLKALLADRTNKKQLATVAGAAHRKTQMALAKAQLDATTSAAALDDYITKNT